MKMSEFIDRQAAYDAIRGALNREPSAQPKRGKWANLPFDGPYWYRCNQCGGKSYYIYAFCPYCGADMRGEEDG